MYSVFIDWVFMEDNSKELNEFLNAINKKRNDLFFTILVPKKSHFTRRLDQFKNVEYVQDVENRFEEPGKETSFVFITEKRTDLLPTLVSRCQTIGFEGLKEYDSVSVELELMFSELLRNAFQIRKDISYGSKIIEWSKNAAKLDRESQKDFFIYSTEIIRQAFLKNIKAENLISFNPKTEFNFSSFSKFVTQNNVEELTNEFEKAFYHTLRNGNSTMIMTDLALKLTKAIHKH